LGDQDELSRLRRRVAELEHTVRVLTQRASPREGEEKVHHPAVGSPRPQGPADEDDGKRKKGRRDDADIRSQSGSSSHSTVTAPAIAIPGQGYPSRGPSSQTSPPYLQQPSSGSPHGSPGAAFPFNQSSYISFTQPSLFSAPPAIPVGPGGPSLGNIAHCGCAISPAGREILGQLQNNLVGSLQRLKAMPEHQRHTPNCPLYTEVVNFHNYLRTTGVTPSSTGPSFSSSLAAYSHQSSYAPSSQSSASPPNREYLSTIPSTSYDLSSTLEATQPYPYTGSHSSTLSQPLSHSLSSNTTSHSHSYTGMAPMAAPGANYPHYHHQSTPQQAQQHQPAVAGLQRPGPSTSVPVSGYTSLSTWNSMSGTAGQPSRSNRLGRSSSGSRPAK
ncbi:hypothetical protein FRB99_009047, partial [Tulasnella sp. 403]